MKDILLRSNDLTRRNFAACAASSFLGLGLMPSLQRQLLAADESVPTPPRPATAKNVIYIFLSGGLSQMDTLDPKPGAEGQGKTGAIKTKVPGIQVGEYMKNLADRMDKAAIVRAIGSTQGSHYHGRYYMKTSYAKRGTIVHPSLGAWVNKYSNRLERDIPDYVTVGNGVGSGVGYFEAKYSPLPISSPESGIQNVTLDKDLGQARFDHRLALSDKLDQAYRERYDRKDVRAYTDMYADAINLMKSPDLGVFDLSQESKKTQEAYGNDRLGKACLLARRLVEKDVRFIEINSGGWDHHYAIYDKLPEMATNLDKVLGTLIDDLEARGLLDSTLVVVGTEFGRTPVISGRLGRNHYPRAFSCLMAGGGVKGGQVYGATDEQGREAVENARSVPDFNATIAHLMGMPIDQVLFSPSNRPFQIAHDGKPILELM